LQFARGDGPLFPPGGGFSHSPSLSREEGPEEVAEARLKCKCEFDRGINSRCASRGGGLLTGSPGSRSCNGPDTCDDTAETETRQALFSVCREGQFQIARAALEFRGIAMRKLQAQDLDR